MALFSEQFRYGMREKWERLRDWLENLAARRWINDNPKLIMVTAAASAIFLAGVAAVYFVPRGPASVKASDKAWFYDLNTGRLFIADKDVVPPIDAPSGPLPDGKAAGVKACVLTYAAVPTEADRFVGYLETADPNFVYSEADPESAQWGRGMLIRGVGDRKWVCADSPQGRVILEKAFVPNENGERPYYVRPK